MPLILANILRQVILAVGTGAVITGGQAIADGSVEAAVQEIRDDGGLTLEEAKDIVANFLLDLGLNSALIFGTLKTRLGVRVADFLGFSTKGFKKRALSPKAAAYSQQRPSANAEVLGSSLLKKIGIIAGTVAAPIWLINALAQIVEPGIYQPAQTNAVYRKLGIPFQYPLNEGQLQPGPFDAVGFKEYARALEAQRIRSIKNPCAARSQPYTKQGLADLIDCIYGREVANGRAPTKAKFIPLLAPYLTLAGAATPAVASTPAAGAAVSAAPSIKVFTGVVSRGVLGGAVGFVARPDDIIENVSELQDAAHNNLSSVLTSIGNSLAYELKIQNSVTTRDGFTQRGEARQVQSGVYADGRARYKTVVNKFAVLSVYILTDRGSRTLLRKIVLGPTDALKFQPTTDDLATVEAAVKSGILTSDMAQISQITAPQTLAIEGGEGFASGTGQETPKTALGPINPVPRDYYVASFEPPDQIFYVSGNKIIASPTLENILSNAERAGAGNRGAQINLAIQKLKGAGVDVRALRRETFYTEISGRRADIVPAKTIQEFFGVTTPTQTVPADQGLPPFALGAQTLSDFYTALGKPLPPVSERAVLYESLTLGQAAYYTGTTEQNVKLLTALKSRPASNF